MRTFLLALLLTCAAAQAAPPTVTLNASPTSVANGDPVVLTWTTGNLPEICVASSTPVLPAWSGLRSAAGGSKTIYPPNASGDPMNSANFDLRLKCYNDDGSGADDVTTTATGSEPGGGEPGCNIVSADPLFQPAGRTAVQRTWDQAFFSAPFWTPTTYNHPIGSRTYNGTTTGLSHAGRYLSIPFTPATNKTYVLDWAEAQSMYFPVVYNGRPAHTVYVTVSPCAGDFRLENNASEDQFLKRGCRRGGQKNAIRFSTKIATSSTSTCAVVPGQPYFLNVIFADPTDGLSPTEVSCETGNLCEAAFKPSDG